MLVTSQYKVAVTCYKSFDVDTFQNRVIVEGAQEQNQNI